MAYHKWTKEELDFLKEQFLLHNVNEVTALFNEKFNTSYTKKQIKAALNNHKIKCGRITTTGQTAWNKGKKWEEYMSPESQAKSRKTCFSSTDHSINNSNHNVLPIGSESLLRGKVIIKTKEQGNFVNNKWWKYKHHEIWEKAYGKIPKGHIVMFADGNDRNFDLENLVLVKKSEFMSLQQNNLYFKGDAEATKCGINIVKLKLRRNELAKKQINRSK